MKLFLLTLCITAFSCTKDTTEKPLVVKSVTYQRHITGTGGKVVVDTSIHWCRVSGKTLEPYLATTRTNELICDSIGGRLILVIGEPCPLADTHYENGKLKYYTKQY